MNANDDKSCIVIRCRIDGKDSSGTEIYGISINVVYDLMLIYNKTLFSGEKFDDSLTLRDMAAIVNSSSQENRPESLTSLESSLDDYVITSRLFQNDKNLDDPKAMEHKITYFCTTVMSLNAITFLEMDWMSRSELRKIIPSIAPDGESGEDDEDDEPSDGEGEDDGGEGLSNVAIACDPVLDPVIGVPVNELSVGAVICCKLREGSVFYNVMEKVSPDFDGIVTGDVIGVSVNELGTATIAVKLSDDVTGAMKAASAVRVRMAVKSDEESASPKSFRAEVALAAAGVVLFLCLLAILLYFFA